METAARPVIAPANTTVVSVEAWTEEIVQAMGTMAIKGTSVALQIPLDGEHKDTADGEGISAGAAVRSGYVLRRKTSNRDSLMNREALLKGKEGSRQRRRWENDRLLGNPYAQPPSASDWEVHPTHPVHTVPYYLAPLWDAGYARESAARKELNQKARKAAVDANEGVGKVPKELREKLKRSRAAKGLLQGLEEEVRKFVESWDHKRKRMEEEGIIEPDSEDDEVVFVGRHGQMHDMPSLCSSEVLLEHEKLVFDSPEDDHGASFGRWLVHSIGQYYGLRTWSVTAGDPARREAYVGIQEIKAGPRREYIGNPLPRPLWAMV